MAEKKMKKYEGRKNTETGEVQWRGGNAPPKEGEKEKASFRGHGSKGTREPSDTEFKNAFPDQPFMSEPMEPEEAQRFSEVIGWLMQKMGMAPGPQEPPPTPGIEGPTAEQQLQERLRVEQELGLNRGEGAY